MKVGSLVVVKPYIQDPISPIVWRPVADEKTIYTIRAIFTANDNRIGVYFEEGIMGQDIYGEIGLSIKKCVEIQPPISSEEIAELVEDACCVEKSPEKQGVF